MRADPRHPPLSLEAATLLTEGKVAEAIKVVREETGAGLKEARARVEAHIAAEPVLRVQIEMQRREARKRFFLWFLLVDVLIAGGVIYYLYYWPR